jgi:hypothetical protein
MRKILKINCIYIYVKDINGGVFVFFRDKDNWNISKKEEEN